MRVKNKSENPAANAATKSFLERMVKERKYENPELIAITKKINKNKKNSQKQKNKHKVQRNLGINLMGKEWDTLPKLTVIIE